MINKEQLDICREQSRNADREHDYPSWADAVVEDLVTEIDRLQSVIVAERDRDRRISDYFLVQSKEVWCHYKTALERSSK